MSTRSEQLAAKRAALRTQSAVQREHLVDSVRDIETRLAGIDRGIEVARRVVKHPLVLAGGIALIALIGPRKILNVASRAALFLSTGRRVVRMLGGRATRSRLESVATARRRDVG